jgi:hypothetical protein
MSLISLKKFIEVSVVFSFFIFSCSENPAKIVDELNEVDDTAEDADIAEEAMKKTGQICSCDSECFDFIGLKGVCFYGICALEIDSCESGCPSDHLCKKMSLSGNDICFKKWVVTDNVTNCQGSADHDLSCINLSIESFDSDCSKYTEKTICSQKDKFDGESESQSVLISSDEQHSLVVCGNDEDWFEVTVEKGKYMEACIEYFYPAGNLDLKIYDENKLLIASRNPDLVNPDDEYDAFNTGLECLAVFAQEENAKYYLSVTGNNGDNNSYGLTVRFLDFSDGENCQESEYSKEECDEILQYPLPNIESSSLYNNYRFNLPVNYRFATRELIMATRYAIGKTMDAFPGTNPLWINIISQKNGLTPGADLGFTMTYNYSNHTHGKSIDTAFFQKNNDNQVRNICSENALFGILYCSEDDRDSHLVDVEKQLFYIKSLYKTKVFSGLFLVDWLIAEEIIKQAELNNKLDSSNLYFINDEELLFVKDSVFGEGFPAHNTHLHVGISIY